MNVREPARASRVWLALGSIYVIWGSTYVAILYAIETLPPFLMAGFRFLVAGALLYGWAVWRGAERPTLRHWGSATAVGALLLLLGNGGVVWAEKTVPSGFAALLVAIVPAWMVGIEALRPGGERPSARTLIGIVLGLVGVVVLFSGERWHTGGGMQWGIVGLLIASLAWSFGSIWSRTLPLPKSQLLATAMEMLCGGGLLALLGLVLGEGGQAGPAASARSLWALAYLVVFGSLIGFTAYIWLLGATSPALASTYAFVNPVVAVFLGWMLANEPVTARTAVATAVIVGGVIVITVSRTREKRALAAEACAARAE